MVLLYLLQIYVVMALLYTVIPFLFVRIKRERNAQSEGLNIATTAVVIPAYRAGEYLLDSVDALVSINDLPSRNIVVVCDHCEPELAKAVKEREVTVLDCQFENSTKVKAMQAAIRHLPWNYQHVVILDADNVVSPHFFEELSAVSSQGYPVVQGKRVAKNEETGFAVLDALSEQYNNLLFREIRTNLGFSSALIGSGFSMNRSLYERIIPELSAVGGFDKELEIRLMMEGIKIGYAAEALVYDEKVSEAGNFENQRRRWISAQIVYLAKRGGDVLKRWMETGNRDLLDRFGQLFFPPRTIMLLMACSLLVLSILFGELFFSPILWGTLLGTFASSVLFTAIRENSTQALKELITTLPSWIFHMTRALIRVPGANRTFIHTEHR